jgi:septum formation protein
MPINPLGAVETVILASASQARAAVLRNAGVAIECRPADIDEGTVKSAFRRDGRSAADVASSLAEMKAQVIGADHAGRFVIGADQMLQCGGAWFDKPADLDHARAHLRVLRGKTHELFAAICVFRDDVCLWRHLECARMTMRSFSDEFLDAYLDAVGEGACESVGAYRLEGLGARLFSRIEGDYFTILGLPLLPLLGFFADHGVVKS